MKNDKYQPSFRFIETDAALQEIIPLLLAEETIGVDLEADSLFHFTEKVCLIQMATPKASFLLDPLQISDMSPLAPVFADTSIKKVFHGADYDIRSLYRDFHIQVNNLFDTELACRFLGRKTTGLNAVVQHLFDVTLDKKYQKKDWSQRPLPEAMLAYAAQDIIYLIPIYQILSEELGKRGRREWVDEECLALSQVRAETDNNKPLFVKFKGAGRLSRRRLAILEAVLQTRRSIAENKDRPPFKVLSNKAIMEIVHKKTASGKTLQRQRILSPKQWALCGEQLVDAIQAALNLPEAELPVYPRQKRTHPSASLLRRMKRLKQWRDEAAADLYIDPGVIFPKTLMAAVAEKKPDSVDALATVDGLKKWRKEAFGRDIVNVLEDLD